MTSARDIQTATTDLQEALLDLREKTAEVLIVAQKYEYARGAVSRAQTTANVRVATLNRVMAAVGVSVTTQDLAPQLVQVDDVQPSNIRAITIRTDEEAHV